MIVVMPMAGRGSRFSSAGVDTPKPFIDVAGRPMFTRALESTEDLNYHKLIIIVLEEHLEQFDVSALVGPCVNCPVEVISIPDVTDGQLCTVLLAANHFNKGEDLLIVPADTLVVSDLDTDLVHYSGICDGLISVAEMPGDHWSFAKFDKQKRVTQVAEKERISEFASTGLYYFSDSALFAEIATKMIEAGEKTKGEYYIMPLYQKYIQHGLDIRVSEAQELWDMGNPEALKVFLQSLDQHE